MCCTLKLSYFSYVILQIIPFYRNGDTFLSIYHKPNVKAYKIKKSEWNIKHFVSYLQQCMSNSSLWPSLRWCRRLLWSVGLLVLWWWIPCCRQKLWSTGEWRIRPSSNPDLPGQNHLSISWLFDRCLMEYSSCQYSWVICNELSFPSPSYLKPEVEKPFESNSFLFDGKDNSIKS